MVVKNAILALTSFGAILAFPPLPATVASETTTTVAQEENRSISTRRIKIKTSDSTLFDANIGYITVPENRSNPDSNTIRVAFMQVISPAKQKTAPVFHFHGGPDDDAHLSNKVPPSVLQDVNSTTPVTIDFSFRSRGYREYLEFADVVIMDDRGMGLSLPRLTCSENPKPSHFFKPQAEQTQQITAILHKCYQEHASNGVDLSAYNLNEIAADFNDIRQALGYDKTILQGTSFGSQTAFTIMQRYPDHVARAYLSGLEGLADTFDIPSEIQEATNAFIAHANANKDVRDQLPNGDMGYTLRTIFNRLKKAPQHLELEGVNGAKHTLFLDHRAAGQLLLSLGMLRYRGDTPGLGSSGASETIPLILALYHEAYDGLAAVLAKRLLSAADDTVFNAGALAIDCASGMSARRRSEFLSERSMSLDTAQFLPLGFEGLVRGKPDLFCDAIPVDDMGEDWRTEQSLDIPVLFYHGDFDGTTPPENARRAIKRFPKGKLVMVQGAAHYKLEMEYLSPELKSYRTNFVKTGELPDNLPDTVTLPPIQFETIPTPALWAFQLGFGNTVLKLTN